MSLDFGPSHFPTTARSYRDAGVKPSTYDWFERNQTGDAPLMPRQVIDRPTKDRGSDKRVPSRRRHAAPTRSQALVTTHRARFTRFSAIGGGIFIAGLVLQAVLTSGLHVPSLLSYVVQAVVSIEASFLLNRWYTWNERSTAFWPALLRFNVQKTITVTANLVLYAGLLKLSVNYLLANVLLTVVFTVVNYIGGDRFVFTPGRTGTRSETASVFNVQTIPFRAITATRLPTVSVVIPCRANEKTIRAAVDSLIVQNYPELREIILVGSPGDSTWGGLAGVLDRRVVILETETPPGIRDANFKRDLGIRETNTDLVALVDSDMVLPYTWLSRAVTAIVSTQADCVAGVMRSVHDDFWGRFVDNCRLGAKTPRVADSYFVRAEDFGAGAQKPPITANILFYRSVYERCPIDSSWSHGSLEDYEWFWRVVQSGYHVLVTNRLFGWHHHRAGLTPLVAEYRRSARGCAYFIRAHRQSPFARKRLMQAVVLPLAAAAALSGGVAAVAMGYEMQTAALVTALGLITLVVLCGREFARTRTLESLAYPLPALVLGASYTASLVRHLIKTSVITANTANGALYSAPPSVSRSHQRTDGLVEREQTCVTIRPIPIRQGKASRHNQQYEWKQVRSVLAFSLSLAVGIMMRLWHLNTSPAWQWDEAVYYRIGINMQHGLLAEHTVLGGTGEPFLYQPPFYFLILGRWFALTGASIYHARLLGILATSLMFVLLFRLLWKVHGRDIALLAIMPIVFDGWLLYIECSSYIENVLMLLIVITMFLYQRALEKPSQQRFVAAGLMLGFVTIFKQTGAYLLVAILICWFLKRREHRGHVMLFSAALIIIVTYVAAMTQRYDSSGNNWYIYQTTVQVRRVLGLQHSGGTLTSPLALLHLLVAQYKAFIPSLLVAIVFVFITARRLISYYGSHKWLRYDREQNALLLSWAVAGIIVFGVSSLKFPQYFALVLIPVYCLGWSELASWKRRTRCKCSIVACAVVCGIVSFVLSMSNLSGNPFGDVQQYAAAHIPSNSVIVTEQGIGDLIGQPWCTVEDAKPCFYVASYAITWQTYLQSSFREGDASFRLLMKDAVRVGSFTGAAGTVTIWKLRRLLLSM